jgi:hypothetical protein
MNRSQRGRLRVIKLGNQMQNAYALQVFVTLRAEGVLKCEIRKSGTLFEVGLHI